MYISLLPSLSNRCVSTADREGGAVDRNLCNQDDAPPETQACSLLCPSECVMSEWGTWSKCPQVISFVDWPNLPGCPSLLFFINYSVILQGSLLVTWEKNFPQEPTPNLKGKKNK